MSPPAILGVPLHRRDIRRVLRVEKHVGHRRGLAMDATGVPREDGPLGDDLRRVRVEERAGGDQMRGCVCGSVASTHVGRRVGART